MLLLYCLMEFFVKTDKTRCVGSAKTHLLLSVVSISVVSQRHGHAPRIEIAAVAPLKTAGDM